MLAPGVLIPRYHGGDLGYAVTGEVRYGFEVGPLVIAPGVRLAAHLPPDTYSLGALATGRITWPVGAFSLYVIAGVGPGYLGKSAGYLGRHKAAGMAYAAGGGLMFHIASSFAVGAEVAYVGVFHMNYPLDFVGPSLLFNL